MSLNFERPVLFEERLMRWDFLSPDSLVKAVTAEAAAPPNHSLYGVQVHIGSRMEFGSHSSRTGKVHAGHDGPCQA